jgi:protein subunit release factor B
MNPKQKAKEKFEKVRQKLLDNCEIKMVDRSKLGGQQVSVIRNLVSIKSKDLDIEIICGYHKSQISNTETARLMMKRAIETIIEQYGN